MKKIKKYYFLIPLIVLGIIWFSYESIMFNDSIGYFALSLIVRGHISLSSWDICRGWGMPLMLAISGINQYCYLALTYIVNIVLIVLGYRLLKKLDNRKNNIIMNILYLGLIVFNPLIIGYSHTLLTEAFAPMLFVASCFLSYKLYDNKSNKKEKIISFIIINMIMIFSWFLKQPYLVGCFMPLCIAALISIIEKLNIKNIIKNISVISASIIILIISILSWNFILTANNVSLNSNNNTDGFLSRGIVRGLVLHYRTVTEKDEKCNIKEINKSELYSTEEKQLINKIYKENPKNYCNLYEIYDVTDYSQENVIERDVYELDKNGKTTTVNSIKFMLKAFFKHPILVLDSYLSQYLVTIDLFEWYNPDTTTYIPRKDWGFYNRENFGIGQAIYRGSGSGQFEPKDLNKDLAPYLEEYSSKTKPTDENLFTIIWRKFIILYQLLFSILFAISPFVFIYNLIYLIKNRSKNTTFKYKKNKILCMIFGTAFIHVMFHSALNAIIDRYAYAAYPLILIGFICLLIPEKREVIMKKEKIKAPKNPKILFVIPAYNESENIGKVLKEIKQDVDYADILVINDCSKDNTKEIVEANGVKCITNIFNMRYAMAVQTGIKYAYENDYDYVIQFDADGQHIAKEAEKLLKTMQEKECDIVIGSRYLIDTGYPCPFFRRVGTKLFEILIKLFTNERIADPLSGFQCLNRRVIKKYATMGNYPEFPDANLVLEMLIEGYDIVEEPAKMRLREVGESMHGGIIKPIKYMINMLYTIVFIVISTPKAKVKDNE